MIQKLIASLLLTFGLIFSSAAQDIVQTKPYPKDYFRGPLDLPPATVGAFAELRPNHFHSGLDFRTNQQDGFPVHAAADGFVSRLRVQFGGFGNAIYITHSNGYTTVYGHLQSFSPELAELVHNYQVQMKTDIVDFNLLPLQVPVSKGQVIALSGHTGAVAGPHVHFEIRDAETQQTINPQLFGLALPDTKPPVLGTACVYSLNGPFSEKTERRFLSVVGSNGIYHLAKPQIIEASGLTGFAVTAYDSNNTSVAHNGVYSIELKVDGKTIFTFAAERFAFDQTHAINAFIDYPEFLRSSRFFQKCFILPGSKITLYPQSVNRGIINFNDDSIHEVEYVVKDVAGNTSTLKFKVKSSSSAKLMSVYKLTGILFHYDKQNNFSSDKLKISIPPGNLYDDLDFTYSELPRKPGAYSPTYQVGTKYASINDSYDLWIKPDSNIGKYADKAVIVNTDGVCEGGIYQDGYIKANPHTFGAYFIWVDTVPPMVTPINIVNGGSMAAKKAINVKIGDTLSGVKTYMGYIDGQWVLMKWDFKSKILSYTFDGTLARGKHTFELTVTDQENNAKTFKADFYR